MKDSSKEKLVNDILECADWCDGNIWEVPIMTPDYLRAYANQLADSETVALFQYPHVQNNPMFAISYCQKCKKTINNGRYKYCPWCGRKIVDLREMTVKEFLEDGYAEIEVE